MGYLLNMTHAVPIVGLEGARFTNVESSPFTAGGYLLDALLTHNLDIGYIGPGPYLNALSKGVKLKLLRVSCIAGNSLIVPKYYKHEQSFAIKKLAVPQYGNTQDLLAKILVNNLLAQKKHHEESSPDMKSFMELPLVDFDNKLLYIPVHPAELETVFFREAIDAALVAEPWGTMLESKGLVNLNELARKPMRGLILQLEGSPNSLLYQQLEFINKFPTTLLVVEDEFYKVNKDLVDNFVKEQDEILNFLKTNESESVSLIKQHLESKTKKTMEYDFLLKSFRKVIFTDRLDHERMNDLMQAAFKAKYIRSTKMPMITELMKL